MDLGSILNSQPGSQTDGVTYGYIRVSTVTQHDDRQRLAMEDFGVTADRLFVDKQSGKNFARPAYMAMMAVLKPGDTVVVQSLDRLGRDYDEMIRQMDIISREKKATLVALDLPLLNTKEAYGNDLTRKLITNLFIQIFSYVAQMEREMNHRRTMEGLAAARVRGVKFGRRPMKRPEGYEAVRKRWERGELSEREAARLLKVSRPTFHKWVHE
ncbi:MAG: recombinase family protein [Selenomonadaceae bacterium]|nr:recombinase family protein [Selenomonadaceae bacterium]